MKLIKILALSALSFNALAIPVYNYDEVNTHTHSATPKWSWNLAPGQEIKNDATGDYFLPHTLGSVMGWTQAFVCLKSFGGPNDVEQGVTSPMLPTDKIAAQISIINMDLNPDGTHAASYGEYYFNTAINSWSKQCEEVTFLNQLHLWHNLKVLVKARNLGTNTAPAMITFTILGQ